MRRHDGFSLIELVLATALSAVVLASVSAMVNPSHGLFETALEAADMQQRLRVAVDSLSRDLTAAGSGAYAAGEAGPLIQSFAPVLPFRQGLSGDAAAVAFQTDGITLISVPSTAAQTTLVADLLPGDVTLRAAANPACPAGTNLCGFTPGMTVLIYDDTGNFDGFIVAAIADGAAQITLTSRPADSAATTYRRGSRVVEARVHVYYLKADAVAQTFHLMHDDGSAGAAVPVVDHIVGLAFEYYGEPTPPSLTPGGGATYGPAPPDYATQTTAYPAGENCTFRVDASSGAHVSRLTALGAGTALVPLTVAQLVDGPWCPDESHANRWDADLLRIRRIAVTIRVEAAAAALRGPAGVLFSNGGSSRAANRWLPDVELRFQIAPRNMNLAPP